MSIWATTFELSDNWEDDLFPADQAPIRYVHSGNRPDPEDRAGSVDLATLPGRIIEEVGAPYLRLGVAEHRYEGHTVVLDTDQVIELRDELTRWLEAVE